MKQHYCGIDIRFLLKAFQHTEVKHGELDQIVTFFIC